MHYKGQTKALKGKFDKAAAKMGKSWWKPCKYGDHGPEGWALVYPGVDTPILAIKVADPIPLSPWRGLLQFCCSHKYVCPSPRRHRWIPGTACAWCCTAVRCRQEGGRASRALCQGTKRQAALVLHRPSAGSVGASRSLLSPRRRRRWHGPNDPAYFLIPLLSFGRFRSVSVGLLSQSTEITPLGVTMTAVSRDDPLVNLESQRIVTAKSSKELLSLLQGVIPDTIAIPAAWACCSGDIPQVRKKREKHVKQAAIQTGVLHGRTKPPIAMLGCACPRPQPFRTRVCVANLQIKKGRAGWEHCKDPQRHNNPSRFHGCQYARQARLKKQASQMKTAVAVRVPAARELPTAVLAVPVGRSSRSLKRRPTAAARKCAGQKRQKISPSSRERRSGGSR